MKLEVLELYTACYCIIIVVFVFFNDTATTEIYTYGHTLSLHDALPICRKRRIRACPLPHWSRTASSSRGRPLPTSGGATGRGCAPMAASRWTATKAPSIRPARRPQAPQAATAGTSALSMTAPALSDLIVCATPFYPTSLPYTRLGV